MLEAIINLDAEYWQAYITMGESGIGWIDAVFRFCVIILVKLSKFLSITYEELNVWLFVIILPTLMLFSFVLNAVLAIKLKHARKKLMDLGAY
ncbi:hypothetical protein N9X05_08460 [Paracoccaceae bacterium]|jgi:hypothetical protein|nr:hypothetical protein [Paracoccaceae bacterium]